MRAAPTYDELVERMSGIQERLRQAKRTVATAESCTGGLLAAVLTERAGSSAFYRGGATAYSDDAKAALVDVPPQLIGGHGAVSSVVAAAMARGARQRLGADIGLGVTGIAGPDGATPGKPVGLVHVAVDASFHAAARRLQLRSDRAGNRLASVAAALDLLEEALA